MNREVKGAGDAVPQLSVVVATYNRLPSRAPARAAGRQTLPPEDFEVVVVDDGSREPRAPPRWRRSSCPTPARGGAGQRGRRGGAPPGRAGARGRVVLITDDDMQVAADFLEQHLARHPRGLAQRGARAASARTRASATCRCSSAGTRGSTTASRAERARAGTQPRAATTSTPATCPSAARTTSRVRRLRQEPGPVRGHGAGHAPGEGRLRASLFADGAYVLHGSDHTSFEKWLAGRTATACSTSRIARKHPDVPQRGPVALPLRNEPPVAPAAGPRLLAPRASRAASRRRPSARASAVDRLGLERARHRGHDGGVRHGVLPRRARGGRRARARAQGLPRLPRRLRRRGVGRGARGARHAIEADHAAIRAARRSTTGRSSHPAPAGGRRAEDRLPNPHPVPADALLPPGGALLAAKASSRLIRHLYGSDIHWDAEIAPGAILVHGMGLAINGPARVGPGAVLSQQVTLGESRDPESGRSPVAHLEANVHVGPGARLLGPITIARARR